MKTCPVCALDLEDTYLFCPEDGSSLDSLPERSSQRQSASSYETDGDQTIGTVLYCPVCAAEYPLTFSKCPVHDTQLAKHRITELACNGSEIRKPAGDARAKVAELQLQGGPHKSTEQLTRLDLKPPEIDEPNQVVTGQAVDNDSELAHSEEPLAIAPEAPDDYGGSVTAFDYDRSLRETTEERLERPGFRVAAIATVIALAVFGLVAIYSFVSNLSRRSSAPAVKLASTEQSSPQALPFVPTPKEAQDYQEEVPAPAASEPAPERPPVARERSDTPNASAGEHGVRLTQVAQPAPKASGGTSSSATTTRVSNELPPLPRGNSGGFDARLIRVRSNKTPAGFRYDLTFNMQEQAGRSAQWQRVLISTRSANGTSHSEAVPFSHRLGAAGALTFTISVELTGRSEADWQGRVVCTTLGWDNKGAPLQAVFGASVAP